MLEDYVEIWRKLSTRCQYRVSGKRGGGGASHFMIFQITNNRLFQDN